MGCGVDAQQKRISDDENWSFFEILDDGSLFSLDDDVISRVTKAMQNTMLKFMRDQSKVQQECRTLSTKYN